MLSYTWYGTTLETSPVIGSDGTLYFSFSNLETSGIRAYVPAYTLYMAVKGATNNNIYIRYMDDTGSWSSWTTLSGATSHAPDMAVFNERQYMSVKGTTNNNIYYRSMDTSGTWDASWSTTSGITSDTPVLCTFY